MKAEYGMSIQVSENIWRKASITLDAVEGEDPLQLLHRCQHEVETFFASPYPYSEKLTTQSGHPIGSISLEKPIPEDQRVEALIQDIMNETVLRLPNGTGGLLAWKLLVQSVNNQKLTATYDEMLKKLS